MMQTANISKRFDTKQVLEDGNLKVEDGHIFGLLGTNGAGKSTLLRIISGIIKPEAGYVVVNGEEVWENPNAKQQICYLTDDPAFLHASSIRQMGGFRKAWQPDYDLERLEERVRAKDAAAALGELLFDAVKLARLTGTDPEEALHARCEDYISAFRQAESERK